MPGAKEYEISLAGSDVDVIVMCANTARKNKKDHKGML
jgi:hypothetical protein